MNQMFYQKENNNDTQKLIRNIWVSLIANYDNSTNKDISANGKLKISLNQYLKFKYSVLLDDEMEMILNHKSYIVNINSLIKELDKLGINTKINKLGLVKFSVNKELLEDKLIQTSFNRDNELENFPNKEANIFMFSLANTIKRRKEDTKEFLNLIWDYILDNIKFDIDTYKKKMFFLNKEKSNSFLPDNYISTNIYVKKEKVSNSSLLNKINVQLCEKECNFIPNYEEILISYEVYEKEEYVEASYYGTDYMGYKTVKRKHNKVIVSDYFTKLLQENGIELIIDEKGLMTFAISRENFIKKIEKVLKEEAKEDFPIYKLKERLERLKESIKWKSYETAELSKYIEKELNRKKEEENREDTYYCFSLMDAYRHIDKKISFEELMKERKAEREGKPTEISMKCKYINNANYVSLIYFLSLYDKDYKYLVPYKEIELSYEEKSKEYYDEYVTSSISCIGSSEKKKKVLSTNIIYLELLKNMQDMNINVDVKNEELTFSKMLTKKL